MATIRHGRNIAVPRATFGWVRLVFTALFLLTFLLQFLALLLIVLSELDATGALENTRSGGVSSPLMPAASAYLYLHVSWTLSPVMPFKESAAVLLRSRTLRWMTATQATLLIFSLVETVDDWRAWTGYPLLALWLASAVFFVLSMRSLRRASKEFGAQPLLSGFTPAENAAAFVGPTTFGAGRDFPEQVENVTTHS